eukprot:c12175_g1_i1.p1 GENE.c12175_g1_i1~~c12175_g1_i1.p1  ORF type:complete len:1027 (-),score=258.83 c12175_g1_i1:170-3250(-)
MGVSAFSARRAFRIMSKCIGIVREVYSKWERRVPLCPQHIEKLVASNVRVLVQPSTRRIFSDEAFRRAGAEVTEDLSPANAIFGVKQVPIENLIANKTYMFFSHTKKAQPANMPMLDDILAKKITLIDYECITQAGVAGAPRLVAFGRFAGNAGMVDALHGLGERLLAFGHSTPFINVAPCFTYPSLGSACDAVRAVGKRLKDELPTTDNLSPLTFVFTGNGKVAQGAMEVFQCLPHTMVDINDLPALHEEVRKSPTNSAARKQIYGAVANQTHMVKRRDGANWTVADYEAHPEEFEPIFHHKVIPYTSVLINCMYWESRFPRLLTIEQTAELHKNKQLRLLLDADLTCDIGGSIEFLTRSTYIERPYFVYNPATNKTSDQLDSEGVLMMGVDILPSELPLEASNHFGDVLVPFVEAVAAHDASASFESLPRELAGACIAAHGSLTPRYNYISSMRRVTSEFSSKHIQNDLPGVARTTIVLKGHLFDSGLINQALDLLENRNIQFSIDELDVTPNTSSHKNESSVMITLQCQTEDYLRSVVSDLRQLASLMPLSQAKVTEVQGNPAHQQGEKVKESPAITTPSSPVLVLGAGLVSAPLIDFLVNKCARTVIVVTALDSEVAATTKRFPTVTCHKLDVARDQAALEKLIQQSQVVVSLLPPPMHPRIAKMCLTHYKHLVTASYVSEGMQALHEEAVAKGIVLLNEMGLDPGMDHMSAKRVIDAFAASGGRVVGFSSVCGGLPAPEAANNPLAYKFSWSPRGVLTASKNASKYLVHNNVVDVRGEDLLINASPINITPAFNLECLPNRNSLPYAQYYGINNAHSVFRGTLRYRGFSSILFGIRMCGLMEELELPELNPAISKPLKWSDLMATLGIGSEEAVRQRLESRGASANAEATINCLRWLGVFSNAVVDKRGNVMDSLCALLQHKLWYAPGERDMVIMQHIFDVEWDGGRKEQHKSTLIAYGEANGDTAMAKTVGITAAIGAELVLQSQITDCGVVMPTSPSVYNPALALLEKEGFRFTEEHSS